MKTPPTRLVVRISVPLLFSFLYVFAYTGSNTKTPTSSSARLDLNICGFQTPLTPKVVRAWNLAFYPLRYVDAALAPDQVIKGELIPPPHPSLCVFIRRDSDAKTYRLLAKAGEEVKLDAFHYGQKVVAVTGTALDNNLDPACLSRGSSGLCYVKSLRPAL